MTDKFCVNCFHFRVSESFPDDLGYAKCSANGMTDLVSGKTTYLYCSVLRKSDVSDCGPEGNQYVDREQYVSELSQWKKKQDSMDTLEQRINEGLDPF